MKERIKKAGSSDETGVDNRKKKICGELEEKNLASRTCEKLVGTVMGYVVEIWGWKERREVEAMQERWIKWTMGIDWCTPGYMMREEIGKDKFIIEAGKRTIGMERKLEEGREGILARKCLEEMEKGIREGKKLLEWERKKFFEARRKGIRGIEERRVMRERGL